MRRSKLTMVQCCIPSCKSRSDNRNWKKRINVGQQTRYITFHSFPKDPSIRNRWLQILNLDESAISLRAFVCSDHFNKDDFDKRCVIARLLPNTLPKAIPIQHETDISVPNEISMNQENVLTDMSNTEEDSSSRSSITDVNKPSLLVDCSTTGPSTSKADKTTMTSRELHFNSPEKCRLRKRIEYLKKNYKSKIRNMQQNVRRKDRRIATLKYILTHLKKKNMLDNEQVDVLQTLDMVSTS